MDLNRHLSINLSSDWSLVRRENALTRAAQGVSAVQEAQKTHKARSPVPKGKVVRALLPLTQGTYDFYGLNCSCTRGTSLQFCQVWFRFRWGWDAYKNDGHHWPQKECLSHRIFHYRTTKSFAILKGKLVVYPHECGTAGFNLLPSFDM